MRDPPRSPPRAGTLTEQGAGSRRCGPALGDGFAHQRLEQAGRGAERERSDQTSLVLPGRAVTRDGSPQAGRVCRGARVAKKTSAALSSAPARRRSPPAGGALRRSTGQPSVNQCACSSRRTV